MATEITIPPKPFTYADGTPAVAGQVNSNFDKVFDENFTVAGYTYFGWWRFGNGLEYNDSNAFQSVSDVDLTTILQEGDKIRWFHDPTNTQKYGWVSHIDYDDTVANRSYVEVIGDTVLDETVELDSIGVSRIANPFGWPQDPDFGAVIFTSGANITQSSPASGTWYDISTSATVVPKGRWRVFFGVNVVGTATQTIWTTVSTSATSKTINSLSVRSQQTTTGTLIDYHSGEADITVSSSTTYYLISKVDTSGATGIRHHGGDGQTVMKFTPLYK
jgi:hypothetical protein